MSLSTGSFDFWMSVGMALSGLFGGLMMGMGYVRSKHKTEKLKEETDINLNILSDVRHSHIQEQLTTLRNLLQGDRAQVLQFHNGGKFLEGSPMKRFSATHESCDLGVSLEHPHNQSVLVTLFWDLIQFIRKDEPIVYYTENLKENSNLRTYNESKNIKAFCVLPLKKEDFFVGFVKLEWNDFDKIPLDSQKAEKTFDLYRSFIELEIVKNRG